MSIRWGGVNHFILTQDNMFLIFRDINIELAHETAQEDSGIFQVMPIPVDLK